VVMPPPPGAVAGDHLKLARPPGELSAVPCSDGPLSLRWWG
jgi:hypothetical protein